MKRTFSRNLQAHKGCFCMNWFTDDSSWFYSPSQFRFLSKFDDGCRNKSGPIDGNCQKCLPVNWGTLDFILVCGAAGAMFNNGRATILTAPSTRDWNSTSGTESPHNSDMLTVVCSRTVVFCDEDLDSERSFAQSVFIFFCCAAAARRLFFCSPWRSFTFWHCY